MKIIRVVAAIIFNVGNVFATQRGYGDFKDDWRWTASFAALNPAI